MAATRTETSNSPANAAASRPNYAGWLEVVRTISSSLDSYRTENLVEFEGGWTELQRFAWSCPLESVWHTEERCYYLSLTLDVPVETNRQNVALPQPMPGGDRRVLLVAPGQTISSACEASGQRRTLRCLLDADFVESICRKRPTPGERAELGQIDFSGGAIEWLLFRMYREISVDEIGMAIAVGSIARTIAVEIAREIERLRYSRTRHHAGGLAAWRMRSILERIHLDAPLPKVRDLAAMSGLTSRHLNRAFQVETGKTIGKFIAGIMVERAGRMLESGMAVGKIASILGYASSSSFAHAFHRETGILPSSISDAQRARSH